MKTTVLFSIGSNAPAAACRVATAIAWLNRHYGPLVITPVYRSKELSGRFADYANAIAIGQTDCPPEITEQNLKQFEKHCGRTSRSKTKGIVEIDIDLIAHGNNIIRPKELQRPYFTYGCSLLPASHCPLPLLEVTTDGLLPDNKHIAEPTLVDD